LIECDLKNKPKELLQLNPYGKVPVLVDGDAVVYESAIINEYLEEKYPEVPLMPKDLLKRARVRIWVDFCNTRLQYAGGKIAHEQDVEKSAQ
jgi:glutathione S-transferase